MVRMNQEHLMNSFGKFVVKMGLLRSCRGCRSRLRSTTAWALQPHLRFTQATPSCPSGHYKVTQPEANADLLLVESINGAHSVFVEFVPTQSAQPHRQSDVTFQKYGDTGYLNRVWIEGQNYGMKVTPGKVETEAAVDANAVQHSAVARGQWNTAVFCGFVVYEKSRKEHRTLLISTGPVDLCVGVNVWRCGVAAIGLSHLHDTPEFRRVINSLERGASHLVDRRSRT